MNDNRELMQILRKKEASVRERFQESGKWKLFCEKMSLYTVNNNCTEFRSVQKLVEAEPLIFAFKPYRFFSTVGIF